MSTPAGRGARGRKAIRQVAAESVKVSAHPWSVFGPIRLGGLLLVALFTLYSRGQVHLAIYASFGAFTSVYGGAIRARDRWQLQACAGALLTGAVLSGSLVGLSTHRAWLGVPVAAAWAWATARISDRAGWRPPGPLFFVFAVAGCSSIPTTTTQVGQGLLICGLTAAVAVLLGAVEVLLAARRPGEVIDRVPPLVLSANPRRQRVHALRCLTAVLIAGAVATSSGLNHPYWAMIASVAPFAAPTVHMQLARAVNRFVGTVAGIGLTAVVLAPGLPPLLLILIVAALQIGVELLIVRHYGLATLFITPLALTVLELAHQEPVGQLLVARLVETAIGVGVGAVLVVLTRNRERPAAVSS